MKAVGVEQLLALLVTLDPAFGAAHALTGYSPQQPLALVAVGGRGGGPHLKVVGRGAGDGVDERLQRLLIDVVFLQEGHRVWKLHPTTRPQLVFLKHTSSSSLMDDRAAMAEAMPAFLA